MVEEIQPSTWINPCCWPHSDMEQSQPHSGRRNPACGNYTVRENISSCCGHSKQHHTAAPVRKLFPAQCQSPPRSLIKTHVSECSSAAPSAVTCVPSLWTRASFPESPGAGGVSAQPGLLFPQLLALTRRVSWASTLPLASTQRTLPPTPCGCREQHTWLTSC